MANSKRKCKYCKEYTTEFIKLPGGVFCNIDHAMEFVELKRKASRRKSLALASKEIKVKQKADRAKHRADKERIKPLSKLKNEAQAAVNKYIRLRDYYDPCISCGKSKEEIEGDQGWKIGGCWDAGHFRSRGAAKHLRFILFNIHKQCKSCNGGSGNFSAKAVTVDARYEENLIDKIGQDKVDWLKNNNNVARFNAAYYRRVKKIFNKKW